MRRRWAIAVIAALAIVALGYAFGHTQFGVSQPCHRNSMGDIVCRHTNRDDMQIDLATCFGHNQGLYLQPRVEP